MRDTPFERSALAAEPFQRGHVRERGRRFDVGHGRGLAGGDIAAAQGAFASFDEAIDGLLIIERWRRGERANGLLFGGMPPDAAAGAHQAKVQLLQPVGSDNSVFQIGMPKFDFGKARLDLIQR
jgi:hypothetical protein